MQLRLAYRDGQYMPRSDIRIGLDDLGFERGFGVFEYIQERNGAIHFLSDHLHRLMHSQHLLQFVQPISEYQVADVVQHLYKANNAGDSYYKVLITGRLQEGLPEPVLTVYQDAWKPYPEKMYVEGVALILEEYAKPFPEYKTTFYLGSLRTAARMLESRAEDVLFYFDGQIRETARCNIWIVKNGLIYTPNRNMLKGVTRKHVMICAQEDGMVIEKDISVEEIFHADEVFITSTTRKVMPVVRIEDRLIAKGKPGPVTSRLMMQYARYCSAQVAVQ